MSKKPSPLIIILCLFCGITISLLLAFVAVQIARTPPPAGTVDPMRLNQSEFRQLGLIATIPQHYILRLVAKEWFFDVGQTRDAPAIITIPQHSTVTLITTSMDVIHSIQIPGNPIITIVPGKIQQQIIVFDTPQTYTIQCGAYCGPKHDQMILTLIITPAQK
jgi:heme/copper-type cytochrome/quinol oxidase subunit 2